MKFALPSLVLFSLYIAGASAQGDSYPWSFKSVKYSGNGCSPTKYTRQLGGSSVYTKFSNFFVAAPGKVESTCSLTVDIKLKKGYQIMVTGANYDIWNNIRGGGVAFLNISYAYSTKADAKGANIAASYSHKMPIGNEDSNNTHEVWDMIYEETSPGAGWSPCKEEFFLKVDTRLSASVPRSAANAKGEVGVNWMRYGAEYPKDLVSADPDPFDWRKCA